MTLSYEPPATALRAPDYSSALAAREMGALLLVAPSIGSTQEFMRRHSGVLPAGAVLAADRQSAGKGAALPVRRTDTSPHHKHTPTCTHPQPHSRNHT